MRFLSVLSGFVNIKNVFWQDLYTSFVKEVAWKVCFFKIDDDDDELSGPVSPG